MNQLLRVIFTLLIAGNIAGCAAPGSIVPNATSANELVAKLGKPTETRKDAQGGESWDYVYGPEGVETWRYGIDQNRMVRSATQLLTQERLHKIVPGVTTEAQVRDLLGKPRHITKFQEETAWEWRVRLNPMYGFYVVRFAPNGLAIGTNVLLDSLHDGGDKGGK